MFFLPAALPGGSVTHPVCSGLLCGRAWTTSARVPVSAKAQQLDTGAVSVCLYCRARPGHPAEGSHLGPPFSFFGHYPERATTGKRSQRRLSSKLSALIWSALVKTALSRLSATIKSLFYSSSSSPELSSFHSDCLTLRTSEVTVWFTPRRQHHLHVAQRLNVGKPNVQMSPVSLASTLCSDYSYYSSEKNTVLVCFERALEMKKRLWFEMLGLKWCRIFSSFFPNECGTNGIVLVMLVESFTFPLLRAFKRAPQLPSDTIKQPLRCIHTWRPLLISSTLYGTTEDCSRMMRRGVKW